ncbi:MAG: hypothetical protein IKZ66_01380, partial [Schwartzia sp.]|nr:hypothetical protein [Schwartzia sp. (in: firmicutes)]
AERTDQHEVFDLRRRADPGMSLSDYMSSLKDAWRDPKNRYDMIDAARAVLIMAATMALATAAAYFLLS